MNFTNKLDNALRTISEMSAPEDMYRVSLDNLHDNIPWLIAADALEEIGGDDRERLAAAMRMVHEDPDRARHIAQAIRMNVAEELHPILRGGVGSGHLLIMIERSADQQLDLRIDLTARGVIGRLFKTVIGRGDEGVQRHPVGTTNGLAETLTAIPSEHHDNVALLIGTMAVMEMVEGDTAIMAFDDEQETLRAGTTQVTKRIMAILWKARELASFIRQWSESNPTVAGGLVDVRDMCLDATELAVEHGSPRDRTAAAERIDHIREGISDIAYLGSSEERARINRHVAELASFMARLNKHAGTK